jgi:membrane protein YdbS with pleckstrin-like domain
MTAPQTKPGDAALSPIEGDGENPEAPERQAPSITEPIVPPIADGVAHPPDPRSVPMMRLIGWLVCASIGGPGLATVVVVSLIDGMPVWIALLVFGAWIAVTAFFSWAAHYLPVIEHRHSSYKVSGSGIEVRSGVIWRRVVNVPCSRVQHTDVSQGPIERMYGLATLLIHTAGTEHSQVSVHGLDHATALRIRDHLMPGSGDDAV